MNNKFIFCAFSLAFSFGCEGTTTSYPPAITEGEKPVDSLHSCHKYWVDSKPYAFHDNYTAYNDTITGDGPVTTLFSPVIALPRDLSWNKYRLRQLDSMIVFSSKFSYTLTEIVILDLGQYTSLELDAVKRSVDSVLKTRRKSKILGCSFTSGPPLPVCTDSLRYVLTRTKEHLLYLDLDVSTNAIRE